MAINDERSRLYKFENLMYLGLDSAKLFGTGCAIDGLIRGKYEETIVGGLGTIAVVLMESSMHVLNHELESNGKIPSYKDKVLYIKYRNKIFPWYDKFLDWFGGIIRYERKRQLFLEKYDNLERQSIKDLSLDEQVEIYGSAIKFKTKSLLKELFANLGYSPDNRFADLKKVYTDIKHNFMPFLFMPLKSPTKLKSEKQKAYKLLEEKVNELFDLNIKINNDKDIAPWKNILKDYHILTDDDGNLIFYNKHGIIHYNIHLNPDIKNVFEKIYLYNNPSANDKLYWSIFLGAAVIGGILSYMLNYNIMMGVNLGMMTAFPIGLTELSIRKKIVQRKIVRESEELKFGKEAIKFLLEKD